MSQMPASAVRTLSTPAAKNTRPAPVAVPAKVSNAAAAPAPVPVAVPPEPRELNVIGPRKLVRPTLPDQALRGRRFSRHEEPALSLHASGVTAAASQESSHAESFYFQKQMQTQTPMVFVLEDGEHIEGCIEWYDRHAIKVRGPRAKGSRPGEMRTLIYKSSIKYLYKAGENGG